MQLRRIFPPGFIDLLFQFGGLPEFLCSSNVFSGSTGSSVRTRSFGLMSLQVTMWKKTNNIKLKKNEDFDVIYWTLTWYMHCMYLAEPITKWTINWYVSTRQHYDLLSHLETVNNIVLFSFLCFFTPTSIYFSQYLHDDCGLLLHLRKRISLLLSLCS